MDFGIGCELVHPSVTLVQILRAVGLMAAIIARRSYNRWLQDPICLDALNCLIHRIIVSNLKRMVGKRLELFNRDICNVLGHRTPFLLRKLPGMKKGQNLPNGNCFALA